MAPLETVQLAEKMCNMIFQKIKDDDKKKRDLLVQPSKNRFLRQKVQRKSTPLKKIMQMSKEDSDSFRSSLDSERMAMTPRKEPKILID